MATTHKYLLALITLLLAYTICQAQDIVVIGQVMSANDGQPLASANVWFKESREGCATNQEGFFMLRSNKPQRTLIVSVVGYKTRNIKLEYGKDQMIEIYLKEDITLLDEIIAIPNQNQAKEIMRNVNLHRFDNSPEYIKDIETNQRTTTHLNLTNIKNRTLQRKLLGQLKSGTISQTDTTQSLPVYIHTSEEHLNITKDSIEISNKIEKQNALRLLDDQQWKQFIGAYEPEINFYHTYSTVVGKNFMNPTAKNGPQYYNYYLIDSATTTASKTYEIRYSPKRDIGNLFKGTIWVDSATYAIKAIDTKAGAINGINFLSDISHSYNTQAVGNKLYPQEENNLIGLQLTLFPSSKHPFFGAILNSKDQYYNTKALSDSLTTGVETRYITLPPDNKVEKIWNGIDSINQTRIQKTAQWLVDLILYQHIHIWKIDLGPILNLYHYNRLEGASPRISLRSNERFAKDFTIGGYYGYGFTDRAHKYGGQIEWRFGQKRNNTLSLFYDHKVERYGYDEMYIYDENRIHEIDHLTNAIPMLYKYPNMAMRGQIDLRYKYEKPGFRFTTDALVSRTYSNNYIPYIQFGNMVDHTDLAALRFDFRLSWKENTLDGYFHRYYLATRYPVVHLTAETGLTTAGELISIYGKFGIIAKQNIALGFSKLHWAVQANAIIGDVPFPLLITPRTSRNSYNYTSDFMLLNQMEFMSDLYVAAHLRYQTRGFIFGYIPYVKKLGIREDIIFNIGYGRMREGHKTYLAIPSLVQSWNKTPYIECGFGFSNILKIADIQFVWRVTHRDNPSGKNFGIKWRLNLDF